MGEPGRKHLLLLGSRGIPAAYGGFETFAEQLATYLVNRGWLVTVYCQERGKGRSWTTEWRGIQRVHIPEQVAGPLGTVIFDFRSILDAARHPNAIALTLGYNTAVFNTLLRIRGQANLINMDGIEWQRAKWGWYARTWLRLNERAACRVANHLIADNPGIKSHLMRHTAPGKITMIPYGAARVADAPEENLQALGLHPQEFALVVARPEPENSILEIVRAFSRASRGIRLVVLGDFSDPDNPYLGTVTAAASDEVLFPGPIYDKGRLHSLRQHCLLYIHGHQVGGTNPSLVEAMGAGSAILANDNLFNRWVAGSEARYFTGESDLARLLDAVLEMREQLAGMRSAALARFNEVFTWHHILAQYEDLLEHYVA